MTTADKIKARAATVGGYPVRFTYATQEGPRTLTARTGTEAEAEALAGLLRDHPHAIHTMTTKGA